MSELVKDSSSLEKYKKKREGWLVCLRGPDVNSVINQVWDLTWRACVFHIVQTAVNTVPRNDEGYAELNGSIVAFLRTNYAVAQMAAIRCLIDHRNGVYSLWRLVDDIDRNRVHVTRANIFDAEGIEYDIQKVEAAYRKWKAENVGPETRGWGVPPDVDTSPVWNRHDFADRISRVNPANRCPSDVISESLLKDLKTALDSCNAVKTHVDKYIAHAATQRSRARLSPDEENPTWDQLDDAIRAICRVASFVSLLLEGKEPQLVEYPPAGWEQYLEQPFSTPENVHKLVAAWEEFSEKAQSWSKWNWDALVEMP